jgi:hypothetical protein
MNEYQSIEMHHGAVNTFYPPKKEFIFPYNYLNGKQFEESAFSGGNIAFIDNEDISFYVNKFKPYFSEADFYDDPNAIANYNLSGVGYDTNYGNIEFRNFLGPPVEIDRKYLNMILNAKKLKASVSINTEFDDNFSYTDFGHFTSETTIEGSFDALDLYISDAFYDEDPYDTFLGHKADWYRRDISSKAAQLNPLALPETVSEYSSSSRNNEITHPLPDDGLIADKFSFMSRYVLPRFAFYSYIYVFDPTDGGGDQTINYSVSEGNEKSGNYSVDYTVTGQSISNEGHNFGVGFVVVTPTKVYAFPHINGYVQSESGSYGLHYTAVYSETYPTFQQFQYSNDISLPPVSTSTITFLGVSIPIYFYAVYSDADYSDPPTGPESDTYTASLAGSFDILVEEEW